MRQIINWCVKAQILLILSSGVIASECDMPEMPRFPVSLETYEELNQFNSEMDGYRDSAKLAIQCLASEVVESGGPGIPETKNGERDVRNATNEMKLAIARANALIGRFHAAQEEEGVSDEKNDG